MAVVGYGTLSVIPSMKGLEAALNKEGNPALIRFGDQAGVRISKGIEDKIGKIKLPRNALVDQGDKIGDAVGVRMNKSIEAKTSKLNLGGLAAGLGSVLLGGKLLDFGKDSFDAFSSVSEAGSKVNVVFGDAAAGITEFASTSAKSLGISKLAALEAAGTYGNLFRAMGIGVDTSAEMSTSLIRLASDLASFNNANPEDVIAALKSGLVGETEPLRQFGVNLNEARIQAEALRLGLVHGNVNMVDVQSATTNVAKAQAHYSELQKSGKATSLELTDAQNDVAQAQQTLEGKLAGSIPVLDASTKAQAAYSLILQDTSLAQGDFARTADGAANKSRIAAAEFDNLKATFGEKISPFGNWILTTAIAGLDAINNWWTEHGPGVLKWFDDVFGNDKVENFKRGLQDIQHWFDETFGEQKVQNFVAGAVKVGRAWDENFASFERGSIVVQQKTQPIWDLAGVSVLDYGNKLIWVKDHGIDPIIGGMQMFSGLQDVVWTVFKDKALDPLIGSIGTVARAWNSLDIGVHVQIPNWVPPPFGGKSFDIEDIFPDIPGFDTGGIVGGGRRGDPRLALVHVGETILPTHRLPNLDAAGSHLGGGNTTITVTGKDLSQPHMTAFMLRQEVRRLAFYAGGKP